MADKPLFRRENKKARFKYSLFDRFEAGLALEGTEVKSIRAGSVSLDEAYCRVKNGEVFVLNLDISPYSHGSAANHEPKRPRKLLLHKREIAKLDAASRQRGYTIVPTKLYLTQRGLFKMEIALAKGKAVHDKREAIQEREVERRLRRYKR